MQASKFRSYWIIFRSILTTLKTSLLVLCCSFFNKKQSRKKLDRYLHQWSRTLLKIARVHFHTENPHHVQLEPHRRYVLMSNHSSSYDIPLIYMIFKQASIRMMAKKELFNVPIWGKAMQQSEFISVDRANARQAVKDLKYAREKLESGIVIWIAPEGTRSKTGKLLTFKKGGFLLAKKTDATIIPITLSGAYQIVSSKSLHINLNQTVTIRIGKPIDTTQYDSKDLTSLMKDVRQEIE